jgi:lathosterol oxidase
MGIVGSFISVSANIREYVYITSIFFDIVQHSSTSIKLPHFLNYILILPNNHYYHHSKVCFKKNGQNFGLIFSFWDLMFGTYYLPKKVDTMIGLEKDNLPKGFIRRLLHPIS